MTSLVDNHSLGSYCYQRHGPSLMFWFGENRPGLDKVKEKPLFQLVRTKWTNETCSIGISEMRYDGRRTAVDADGMPLTPRNQPCNEMGQFWRSIDTIEYYISRTISSKSSSMPP